MLALVEVGRLAAEFAAKYKAELLGLALFIMSFAWAGGCAKNAELNAKLEACLAKPPIVQTVAVEGKAKQTVIVKYAPGSPCPDVEAVNSSDTAVSVTQAASNTTQNAPVGHSGGLWVGGGYLSRPYAQLGLQIGPVQAWAQADTSLGYGGGASWRCFSW